MLASNRFEPSNRRYEGGGKDDDAKSKVWNCLRSKSTVVLLISLFVMEALAALGLGIYYYLQQQDGTLPPLFGTTNTNCYDYDDFQPFTGMQTSKTQLPFGANITGSYFQADYYLGGTDSNGRKSGFGELFYGRYWREDMKNGLGTLYTPEGSIEAEGKWRNDRLSGLALRYYNASFHYRGAFKADLKHGHGLEYINDNLIYEGQFVKDRRVGYGTEWQSGNVTYAGQWADGLRHGNGTAFIVGRPQSYYKGQWKAGLKFGYGRDVTDEANYYEGFFINGKRQGHGKLVYPKYHTVLYDGQWKNDKMNGFGKLSRSSGAYYEGYFRENMYHGQGYLMDADGSKYNVTFQNNMKNGLGTWTLPDEQGKIEGTWTHGSLEGWVKWFRPDGKTCSNKYQKDQKTEEWDCS